jgi:hypothetical protein
MGPLGPPIYLLILATSRRTLLDAIIYQIYSWIETLHISNSFSVQRQGFFHCTECVKWETTDDGHRNCQKHLESVSTNKFKELVHLDGFIVRNYIHALFSNTT